MSGNQTALAAGAAVALGGAVLMLARLPSQTPYPANRSAAYGRAAPTNVDAYQPVSIGIFSTSIPVCGASMM